jgi:hypothetical protein
MHESYEIRQVANGFMVVPGSGWVRNGQAMGSEVHVFPTWPEASKWLGDHFRVEPIERPLK